MIRVPIYKIALSAVISLTLNTYAQQDTQQVEARVNGILSQMTLAEKLSVHQRRFPDFARSF